METLIHTTTTYQIPQRISKCHSVETNAFFLLPLDANNVPGHNAHQCQCASWFKMRANGCTWTLCFTLRANGCTSMSMAAPHQRGIVPHLSMSTHSAHVRTLRTPPSSTVVGPCDESLAAGSLCAQGLDHSFPVVPPMNQHQNLPYNVVQ